MPRPDFPKTLANFQARFSRAIPVTTRAPRSADPATDIGSRRAESTGKVESWSDASPPSSPGTVENLIREGLGDVDLPARRQRAHGRPPTASTSLIPDAPPARSFGELERQPNALYILSYGHNIQVMEYVPRHAGDALRRLLRVFPAVLVFGPRQSGKSTLVRRLLPDWLQLDLERPRDAALLEADPEGFFRAHPRRVVLEKRNG